MEPEIFTYYESDAIWRQEWCPNGVFHREDGPARIFYYESGAIKFQAWYLHGKPHRADGPAEIWYYESGAIESREYRWNGTHYPHTKTAKGWTRKVPLLRIQDVMQS